VEAHRAHPGCDQRILEALARLRGVVGIPGVGIAEHEVIVDLVMRALEVALQLSARRSAIGTAVAWNACIGDSTLPSAQ
jgi:hypothetical protein